MTGVQKAPHSPIFARGWLAAVTVSDGERERQRDKREEEGGEAMISSRALPPPEAGKEAIASAVPI